MKIFPTITLVILLVPGLALADPPTTPLTSFSTAKKKARNEVYFDHRKTLYCGCDYAHSTSASGGVIDATACGYEVRVDATRGGRLEWEHIMPAFEFGQLRSCWKVGHPDCVKSDGTPFKGRKCCTKSGVDPGFRKMEADLHNLAPSVGELNADRSNHPYGIVENEPREYGACDFEVAGSPKIAEPMESIRGDVARVWLYMSKTYNVRLSRQERTTFEAWHVADPVDAFEVLRDQRIEAIQGNKNPWVRP